MRILLLILFVVLSIAAVAFDSSSTSRAGSQDMLLASECEPGEHDDCSGSADSEDEEDEDEEETEEEPSEDERALA